MLNSNLPAAAVTGCDVMLKPLLFYCLFVLFTTATRRGSGDYCKTKTKMTLDNLVANK